MTRIRLVVPAALVLAACVERIAAPGRCPEFCPGSRLTVVDTVLRTVLGRDSAFRGYVRPHEASVTLAADLPGLRSWTVSKLRGIPHTYRFGTDTTQNPIVGVDSLRLEITLVHRDTAAHNLRLHLYRVLKTIDSATTYADLAPAFTDSLVRSVNVDSLLALPGRRDSVTGDSIAVDTTTRQTRILLMLDSAQAPYVQADSGVLAFGVGVSADSLASVALGSSRAGTGMRVTWYVRVDSLGRDTVALPTPPTAGTDFDSFVFDPPPVPLDSTLAVGGIPAARSIVRASLPPAIRDSAQIIRATLVLVPDRPARGVPADSFLVVARRVVADLGAKSPLAVQQLPGDSSHAALAWVRIGSTDTVRIEMTAMVRFWAADTSAPAAFMLTQSTSPTSFAEGRTFAEIRFKPSSDAAFRPALVLTYVPRFRFGVP